MPLKGPVLLCWVCYMCSFSVCVPPGPFLPSFLVCVCVYSGQSRCPLCCFRSPSLVHFLRHVCASTRVSWLYAAGLSSCVCLCACICFVRVCVDIKLSKISHLWKGRNKKDRKLFVGKDSCCWRVCFARQRQCAFAFAYLGSVLPRLLPHAIRNPRPAGPKSWQKNRRQSATVRVTDCWRHDWRSDWADDRTPPSIAALHSEPTLAYRSIHPQHSCKN